MINRIVLVGRLVKDPETRNSTSGNTVCSFTIAVDDKLKGKDGSKTTSYISCICFGPSAENTSKFTRKGVLVGVEGSLRQRRYDRQDGTKASTFEVICDSVQFLEPKGSKNEEIPPFDDAPAPRDSGDDEDESRNLDPLDLPDDSLPF